MVAGSVEGTQAALPVKVELPSDVRCGTRSLEKAMLASRGNSEGRLSMAMMSSGRGPW